jgi:hypothetical protein
MFTLTAVEADALGLGLLVTVLLLVSGVLVVFPRSGHIVAATVECPMLRRRACVELVRDDWTLRVVDVTRCSLLSGYAAVLCGKGCLATGAPTPLTRAA